VYSAYGHTRRTPFDLAKSIGLPVGDPFGVVCPDLRTWDVVGNTIRWDLFVVPRERMVERQTGLPS